MAIPGAIYHQYKVSITDLVFYSPSSEMIVQSENDIRDAVLIGFTILIVPADKNLEIQRLEYGEDPSNAAFRSSQNSDDISAEIDRRLGREYSNRFIEEYGDSRVVGVEEVYNKKLNLIKEALTTYYGLKMSFESGFKVWYPPTTFPIINYVLDAAEKDNYRAEIEDYGYTPDLAAELFFLYPDERDEELSQWGIPAVLPTPIEYKDIIREGFHTNINLSVDRSSIETTPINEISPETTIDSDPQFRTPTTVDTPTTQPPVIETVTVIDPPNQITTEKNINDLINNNSTQKKRRNKKNRKPKGERRGPSTNIINDERQQDEQEEKERNSASIIKKTIKGRVVDSKTLKDRKSVV